MIPNPRFNADALKLAFVFSALCLNGLASYSAPLYGVLLMSALSILAFDAIRRRYTISPETAAGFGAVAIYFCFSFGMGINSLHLISIPGTMIGIGRFLFASTLFIAFLTYVRSFETLRLSILMISIVVAVGSFSISFQIFFGKISWLDDNYMRGGFERYASIFGAVTAIGIVAGFYLAFAIGSITKPMLKYFTVAIMIISTVASLSKAGIANLVLAACFFMALAIFPQFRLPARLRLVPLLSSTLFLITTIVTVIAVPAVQERLIVSATSFGMAEAAQRDDVMIGESILDRLIALPKASLDALYDQRGEFGFFVGAGVGMASTALVPKNDELGVMAHNQIVEFISLGGVGFLFTFLVIVAGALFRIALYTVRAHRRGDLVAKSTYIGIFVGFLSFLINLPFANGLVYQPLQATVFWLMAAIICIPASSIEPRKNAAGS